LQGIEQDEQMSATRLGSDRFDTRQGTPPNWLDRAGEDAAVLPNNEQ
jgi:hypothetical protein